MSIYRMLWCSLRVLWSNEQYDIIFVDQVSAVIPFLKWHGAKVVYYCHHPDLLLVQHKSTASKWKQMYRVVIDWFEAITTVNCDELLVNSKYTKSVVLRTFPILHSMPYLEPKVVYPAIDTTQFQSITDATNNQRVTFLSINRYERKKQIDLAIKALHRLFSDLKNDADSSITKTIKLIIAGGYDERVSENKLYFKELVDFCKERGIKYQILAPEMIQNMDCSHDLFLEHEMVDKMASIYFVTKFPDKQKEALLTECSAVLYTPENEHFGIVPVEAMLAMRPVIACKSGGPLETIIEGETGYLCDSDEVEWAKAMRNIVEDRSLTLKLGTAGRKRVIDRFSRRELENVMQKVVDGVKNKKFTLPIAIRIQTACISMFILWTFTILVPVLVAVIKYL